MAGKFKESLYRVFGLENVEDEPPVQEEPAAPAPRTRGKYSADGYDGPIVPREPAARTVREVPAPTGGSGSYAAYSKPLSEGRGRGAYRATSAVPRTTPQPPAEAPTPLFQGGRTRSDEGVQMIVYQLQSYDDTQRVVDELNAGRTVIVSTERLKTEIAQRALDFIGGAIYALNGNHRKIARGIFVFAPGNVDISGSYANVLPQELRTSR